MNFGKQYDEAKSALRHKIDTEGGIQTEEIILVDRFLNQQLDIDLLEKIGCAFAEVFADYKVQKVVTLEASGIPIAMTTAKAMGVKAIFAKKGKPLNVETQFLESKVYSYTKQQYYPLTLSRYLLEDQDRILLVDDFLARGSAMQGLIKLANQANADVVGIAVAIEKSFQEGSNLIRSQGIPLCSLIKFNYLSDKQLS